MNVVGNIINVCNVTQNLYYIPGYIANSVLSAVSQ
jgi:hypothetical protein